MENSKYYDIVKHYEECLEKYGDSPQGVDWTKAEQVDVRYEVMTDIVLFSKVGASEDVSLLDFGCGLSHLYEYMLDNKLDKHIKYYGSDISKKFVDISKNKYPNNTYYCNDILAKESIGKKFNYVVMNGVFTEKRSLSQAEMFEYFTALVTKVFNELVIDAMAFNVMSKHVEWERSDLFHLGFDELAGFLNKLAQNKYTIRADYGLYEYTVYLYKRN